MTASDPPGLVKCWFAQFHDEPCDFRSDGLPDRCHLIPAQRLRRVYKTRGLPPAIVHARTHDPRVLVLGCRRCHHAFDFSKKIRLNEEDFPDRLLDYAQEFGWYYNGPAEGWRAEYREEEDEGSEGQGSAL
jgi:hypothetical protein